MVKNDGSKFICKLCNEEFEMKYFFMNHLQEIHSRTQIPKGIINEKLKPTGNGHMECLDCNKIFSSKETAREHYKKLHLEIRFTCTICSMGFTAESYMKKHMKAAHMLPKTVENELNKKHEWEIVKVNEDGHYCCKTFSSLTTAKIHHTNVHMTDQNDQKFICKVCNKDFAVEKYMKTHMKEMHVNKKTFKCEICLKDCRSKRSFVSHIHKMHNADKNGNNFQCKICSEVFTVKYNLKNHIAEVHGLPEELIGEKLKMLENSHVQCLDCNKILSSKKSARPHFMKWHMAKKDDSKFICELCNGEFTIKYLLMTHLQDLHGRTKIPKEIIYEKLKPTDDGRMECLDCNKTFSTLAAAKSHQKHVHMTDHDAFKCEVCSKRLSYKRSLKRHMKVHIDKRQRLFSHSGIKEKSWEKKLIPIEGGL